MHIQKDKNSEFLNKDVLRSKRKQSYYQERDKNPSTIMWSFPFQGLTLWSPENKVAHEADVNSFWEVERHTWDSFPSKDLSKSMVTSRWYFTVVECRSFLILESHRTNITILLKETMVNEIYGVQDIFVIYAVLYHLCNKR